MNIRQRLNQVSAAPARGTGRPVFIDFTPTHDWRADEDGSAVLVLSLPGFTREQIKVTAEPSGNIRVRGLRHVGNKNWSRFNSEFRAPEDCSMTGIRAKYEHGNLHITIPKKNPSQSKTPKEEPIVTSAQPEPPQPLLPAKPSESQLAQTSSPSKKSGLQPQPQPPVPPSLPQPEQIQPQPPVPPSLPQPEQIQPQQPVPPSLPQPEQIQPQVPQLPSQLKQQERQILPTPQMAASAPRIESEKMPPRSYDEPPSERHFSANQEELKEWENPESLAERILKGGTEKTKEPSASAQATEEMEQLRKEHLDKRARETEAVIGARLSSELKLEDYIQIARGKLTDERQLLVNMGAAVLVIASIGFYICYNIGGKINS